MGNDGMHALGWEGLLIKFEGGFRDWDGFFEGGKMGFLNVQVLLDTDVGKMNRNF